ncbi:hypothetical protein KJ797_02015, partial [Patescibacteria group bacterium]|nr:hypothetical protein [Patescibacteria group bacterium]
NAAFYTKKFSFHQIPINKCEKDNGWVKYDQSYFENSTEWWLNKFNKYFSKTKKFIVLKKYFKAYLNGFPEAKIIRMRLMETKDTKETMEILNNILSRGNS